MWNHLAQILGTLIIILIAVGLKIGLRVIVNKYRSSNPQPNVNATFVTRVINLIINITAVIAIMILWGVETENLVLALGSVFTVIGVALFAQWSILSNVTSGIILFFSAPFRVGDFIKILDKDMPIEATVEDIFTFYTHLRTKEGGLHIFPNSLLLQKAIAVIESKDDVKK